MTAPPLTPPQTAALAFLATVPSATTAQIATGIQSRGRVTRSVKGLEGIGLVAAVAGPRSNIPAYRITSEGRACLPKFRVAWDGGATGPLARDIADALATTLSAGNGPHWVEAVEP
jgi:DNA-binding MarR family transcriptional regulator